MRKISSRIPFFSGKAEPQLGVWYAGIFRRHFVSVIIINIAELGLSVPRSAPSLIGF